MLHASTAPACTLPEHLLGALEPGSRARRVLGKLGVSIAAIKKELECYMSPGMADLDPRRRESPQIAW
ncbi:MAG TPA: Clp protease N-terminal domain-containing protein [Streptosporangiaceae bacterium]